MHLFCYNVHTPRLDSYRKSSTSLRERDVLAKVGAMEGPEDETKVSRGRSGEEVNTV